MIFRSARRAAAQPFVVLPSFRPLRLSPPQLLPHPSPTPAAQQQLAPLMLQRALLLRGTARRQFSAMAQSMTPIEDTLRAKITEALKPTSLEVFNDSHLHAHHKAMQGVTSRETHFRVNIVSEAFRGKMQPARHRMIYSLMKDEMAREGGIHALQLRTRTPEEEQKAMAPAVTCRSE